MFELVGRIFTWAEVNSTSFARGYRVFFHNCGSGSSLITTSTRLLCWTTSQLAFDIWHSINVNSRVLVTISAQPSCHD